MSDLACHIIIHRKNCKRYSFHYVFPKMRSNFKSTLYIYNMHLSVISSWTTFFFSFLILFVRTLVNWFIFWLLCLFSSPQTAKLESGCILLVSADFVAKRSFSSRQKSRQGLAKNRKMIFCVCSGSCCELYTYPKYDLQGVGSVIMLWARRLPCMTIFFWIVNCKRL